MLGLEMCAVELLFCRKKCAGRYTHVFDDAIVAREKSREHDGILVLTRPDAHLNERYRASLYTWNDDRADSGKITSDQKRLTTR